MLTGALKNKVDSIWEMFWTGGITNPLDVVEQMTYLMFIHDLDETDAKRAKSSMMLELPYTSMFEGHEEYKWSCFRDYPAERMYELMQGEIFPFIKNLHGSKESTYAKYMSDAIFKIPTPQLLSKIVDAIDEMYQEMAKEIETDTKGDVYESLLSKLATAGVNGQFRTPRHIIRMMVEMLDPKPDDTICDPACGTSGFLVAAGEYLKGKYKDDIFYNREKKDHYNNHMFYGYDMDRTMLRVGAMNIDNGVIAKLHTNKPLTSDDIKALEGILWSELGTKEEYEKEYQDKPLGVLVREIVGLDMNSAKEAFAKYLNEVNLDDRQIYFVNQIINYIVKNGTLADFKVLQETPFTDQGEVSDVFEDAVMWLDIMKIIKSINANAYAA